MSGFEWLFDLDGMMYRRKNLVMMDRASLIDIIEELQGKLKEKNSTLKTTRTKLNAAKDRLKKLKGTVEYQRERIIQLYAA